jgi:ATP-dependent Lhr-like helicase
VERLRAARIDEVPLDGFRREDVRVLAATDPANPFGALLPWPATAVTAKQPPKRVAGASVILVAGKPVLYVGAAARQLWTFPASVTDEGGELPLALAALHRITATSRRRLSIQLIDGIAALQSPLREALLDAGFEADYDALVASRFGAGAASGGH